MQQTFGLDFGTTNSVIAACDGEGVAKPIAFMARSESYEALRSALCFWKAGIAPQSHINVEVGPWAIQKFIDDTDECRFMQSIKTFAASESFTKTRIFSRMYTFEDLLSTFVAQSLQHARFKSSQLPRRIVVGRPVRFAGAAPNETLAMSRYRDALSSLGFEEVYFVYEPVAAAFFFAQRLNRSATVLVADFGGGTTDYSIVRFERAGNRLTAHSLAKGGVGIAGDTFDYRIIDKVMLAEIGKGSKYRSMGKDIELPQSWFFNFARWNQLSTFKTSSEFRDLKHIKNRCLEPKKIEKFIELVEYDQGYPLYKAISEAKAELSFSNSATFRFAPLRDDFSIEITRERFETWIAEDLDRIELALDQTLNDSRVSRESIDHVFLTGGTSFVPAIRDLFSRRFGTERISSGDQLISIANGLALIGERADIEQWVISER
jgi:hypothetical chaperone protein